jgi:hypothetical protein
VGFSGPGAALVVQLGSVSVVASEWQTASEAMKVWLMSSTVRVAP